YGPRLPPHRARPPSTTGGRRCWAGPPRRRCAGRPRPSSGCVTPRPGRHTDADIAEDGARVLRGVQQHASLTTKLRARVLPTVGRSYLQEVWRRLTFRAPSRDRRDQSR
ncbi:hypothetical protein, partial [Metallococcus carri]|uniref:hypothetical protein n=1 Tax=Metallococcus carri TaxID=1656884 RepID=UPI001A9E3A44